MKKLFTLLIAFMLALSFNASARFSYTQSTPKNGSSVPVLGQFITVDFGSTVYLLNSTFGDVQGVTFSRYATGNPTLPCTASCSSKGFTIDLGTTYTDPGEYYIIIPAGVIKNNTYSADTQNGTNLNERIQLKFTVVPEPLVPKENEVSPIIGSTVFNLNTITIPFPEETTASLGYGYISNGGQKLAAYVNMSDDGRNAIVTCDRKLEAGPATLEFHEGFFKGESGKLSEKISYTWTVVKASLAIEDFHIYKGYTQEITIDLTNGIDFSGFQADLTLPEGLTVVDNKFTLNRGVEGNHVLQSNVLKSSGKTRLLCYPTKKVDGKMPVLTGESGDALVTFIVQASANFTGGEIVVDGIVFSTADGEPYMLSEAEKAAIESRTYVSSITIAPSELNLETNETARVTATVAPDAAFDKTYVWSSSNPEYVTVDEYGVVTAVKPTEAENPVYIIATAQDGSNVKAQIPVTVVYTHAQNLAIDPAAFNIEATQKKQLVAVFTNDNGDEVETNKSNSIVWTSSDPLKVTVDEKGLVEAIAVTEENTPVIITARIMDGEKEVLKATSEVTVKATLATSVTVTPEVVTLEIGGTCPLTATVDKLATNKNVVWSVVSGADYVSIDSETGVVTAKAVTPKDAPAVVKATTVDGSNLSDTAQVIVLATLATNVEVALVEGYDYDTELKHTEFVELKATLTGIGETTKPIVWTAVPAENVKIEVNAETGVAKVTANATVGAVTVYATVKDTDVQGSIDLNIVKTPVETIAINYEGETKFETGAGQVTLTATVGPELATDKTVTWTSSDEKIAAVANGVVTIGQKPGIVTITVKANGAADGQEVKATINFEVVYTFAEEIVITSDSDDNTLKAGESLTLTATTDATTNKAILWTSSDTKVATVNANGEVTAVGVGQATITATIEGTEIADTLVVTVEATPGDVNNDGVLDVFDIQLLVGYIMEAEGLPENFVKDAADYNGDGFVNVADVIALSYIALKDGDTIAEANARMYRTRQYADSSNSLFIEDFTIVEGETKQIAIMLNNNAAFSAFQADIYLPEGLEIVEATLSDRKADHTLASAMRNNGSVRLLSYSMGLNSYAGSEGELVYLTVKATDNFVGDFQIEIENIKFATVDFAEYYLEPTVANVAGYTGVEGVEGDEIVVKVVGNSIVAPEGAEVYDLNGLRVNAENLAKGIYIVKVGNQVVKVII